MSFRESLKRPGGWLIPAGLTGAITDLIAAETGHAKLPNPALYVCGRSRARWPDVRRRCDTGITEGGGWRVHCLRKPDAIAYEPRMESLGEAPLHMVVTPQVVAMRELRQAIVR